MRVLNLPAFEILYDDSDKSDQTAVIEEPSVASDDGLLID